MNNTQAIVYNIREVIKLKDINAELLEALELVMRCDEKGFISLMPSWHNRVRRAIAKAKEGQHDQDM